MMEDGLPLMPGCNDLEQPFLIQGVRWLYCWQPHIKKHCYMNLSDYTAVWDRDFHPATSPWNANIVTADHSLMSNQATLVKNNESFYW